ncbi:CAP domain-containing protein [Chitinophaga nivalis]|uniref:CAP domain-containing protein n=1 Tax=Chitinophaga nivalis TaxID=2991709 RepID=A0ABT3IHM7_9BACT|nr:CAP domain-containing protein [Chitinophaga nivalis]MCW3466846.1 CAP domain-containing protein [Chitinophaga nivalis]MCW3483463.1 CAP domain-containing protein [Chitinophaga nivalis]
MLILKNRQVFLLLFALFAVFQAVACAAPATPRAKMKPGNGGNLDEQILYYTNKFRQSKGLKPLQLSDEASREARQHSRDMASGRTGFGHEGFEDRIAHVSKQMGRIGNAAENVAYGTLDAEAVVDGWIKSPGHRKNMLGDYNLIGIGTADKGRITFFTQVFIKK